MNMHKNVILALQIICITLGVQPAKAAYYSFENSHAKYRSTVISAGLNEACYDNGTNIVSVNERGDALLYTGGSYCNNNDLMIYSGGVLKNITNGQFRNIGYFSMNNFGHVAFISMEDTATIYGNYVISAGNIYLYDGTTTLLIVSKDMLSSGDFIGMWDIALVMNDNDQIAFTAAHTCCGTYYWNNVYLYSNNMARNITNSSFTRYSLDRINNQGKILMHGGQFYFDGLLGYENVLMYDGVSILNLSYVQPGYHASVVDINNAGIAVYTKPAPTGCRTYSFDGVSSVEVTMSDGASFCYQGGINDAANKVFSAGNQLLYCENFTCSPLLTDFPIETSYSGSDITNSGKILMAAATPDESIFPSGQYLGSRQPFELTSLTVSGIAEKEATISWDSEVPASTRIEYGTTYSLGSVIESSSLTTSHIVTIDGLQPFTKYFFRVVSVEETGNKSVSSVGQIRTLDVDLPSTAITVTGTRGNEDWYISDVLVSLSASDATSGVREIRYTINDGEENIISDGNAQINLTSEGIYTIRYYAADNAGNAEMPTSITVKVDNIQPYLNLSATPDRLWPANGDMVQVTIGGDVSDSLSGVESVTFTAIDEYGLIQPSVATFGTTIMLKAWREGIDQDGRHYTITAIATDKAGNISTASAVVLVPHDKR